MPASAASKLGIQFARFVAASGSAASGAHQGFRSAFGNTGSVFGPGAGSSASSSGASAGSWGPGLSSGGASSSASGTGVGGAKFHAGRGAHSTFQHSGRTLVNANGTSSHDGANTFADDEDEASIKAARVHRSGRLHRSTILSSPHRSTLSSLAARQRLIESRTLPALQLILPNALTRSASYSTSHVAPAQQVGNDDDSASFALEEGAQSAQVQDAYQTDNYQFDESSFPGVKNRGRARVRSSSSASADQVRSRVVVKNFAAAIEQTKPAIEIGGNSSHGGEDSEVKRLYFALLRAKDSRDPIRLRNSVQRLVALGTENWTTPYYNLVLESMLQMRTPCSEITEMTDLYTSMINSSCAPNFRTVGIMIEALCIRDMETLLETRIPPSQDLIDLPPASTLPKISNDYFAQALSLFNISIKTMSRVTTIRPFDAILRGCVVRGDAARASDVLNIISSLKSISPSAHTFVYLLQCLARGENTESGQATDSAEQLEACRSIFAEYELLRKREGWQATQDDADVWHTMLRILFKLGDPADAIELLQSMLNGTALTAETLPPPKPTSGTPAAVISAFLSTKDWNSALEWYQRILKYNSSKEQQSAIVLPMPSIAFRKQFREQVRSEFLNLDFAELTSEESARVLPILKIINEDVKSQSDALVRGVESDIDDFDLSANISLNASVAGALRRLGKHEESNSVLDSALEIIQGHFNVQYPLAMRDPTMRAARLEDAVISVSKFVQLADELIAADRVNDAASMSTYIPIIFRYQNLGRGAELHPERPEFKTACDQMSALAHQILKTSKDQPEAAQLALLTEMALQPLKVLNCMPLQLAQEVVSLFAKVAAQSDFNAQSINIDGWHLLIFLFKKVECAELDTPWAMLFENLAKLPEDVRTETRDDPFSQMLIRKYGEEAYHPINRGWQSHKSAGLDEMLSSLSGQTSAENDSPNPSSPASSFEMPNTLPAVQVIDKDLGFELTRSTRSTFPEHKSYGMDAQKLLARVRASINESGTYPNDEGVCALLVVFGRKKDFAAVNELYAIGTNIIAALQGDLQQQSVAWSRINNAMMSALAHAGDAKGASEMRHKLISGGGVPNANSYAALIAVVRDTTDDALVAEELFEESQRLKVPPSTYLLNTVISKLCRARKVEKAMHLFNRLHEYQLRPTSITYGALINGYVRKGDEETAQKLFAMMTRHIAKEARAPPFNNMIQLYTYTHPNFEKAMEYYNKMLELNVRPTGYTYKLLLDLQCIGGQVNLKGLDDVFGRLIARKDLKVQGNHWASLIKAHGELAGNLAKAIEIFDSIPSHPASRKDGAEPFKREAVIFQAMLDVFLKHGKLDEMHRYLEKMRAENVMPTAYIAHPLLRALAQRDIQEARALFSEMGDPPMGVAASGNHPPNHRQHADSDGAVSTSQAMYAPPNASTSSVYGFAGVLREPSTFETMIKIELEHEQGSVDAALWLLSLMEQRGYPPALVLKARALIDEAKKPVASDTQSVAEGTPAQAADQPSTVAS